MNKNILILKKDIKDKKSGAPRIVFDQIRFFTTHGFTVHVAAESLNASDIKQAGGVAHKTKKWPFDGYNRRRIYRWQARRLQEKLSPLLTIGHGDTDHDDVSYIHNCVHLAHLKIHDTKIDPSHPVGMIHTDNFQKNHFKKLVCNSIMMKEDLIQRFSIPEQKVHVEYPKFDSQKFFISQDKKESMREKLGYKKEIVIGLITSGNFKKRNIQFFLECIHELNSEDKSLIKVLIAGKNKDDKYQKYVEENSLSSIVQFAPSIMNVEDYYNAIDIFVLPAKIEEFGLSVVEAMACGTPVVVSDSVGSGELLSGDYSRSRLAINKENFVERISELIKDKELRDDLVKRGLEINQDYPLKYSFNHLLKFIK